MTVEDITVLYVDLLPDFVTAPNLTTSIHAKETRAVTVRMTVLTEESVMLNPSVRCPRSRVMGPWSKL